MIHKTMRLRNKWSTEVKIITNDDSTNIMKVCELTSWGQRDKSPKNTNEQRQVFQIAGKQFPNYSPIYATPVTAPPMSEKTVCLQDPSKLALYKDPPRSPKNMRLFFKSKASPIPS